MWRGFYEAASFGGRDLGALMNYGYAPLNGAGEELEPRGDRFGLQLYEAVAAPGQLAGKDVLEVGCGRGGGAAFVYERFGPRSMTGLDLAHRAVQRARERYGRPGLAFISGDAEELPFPDASFDAILSVESTHCYSNTPRFLRAAHRVLRPHGLMLLADLRHTVLPPDAADALFRQEDVCQLKDQLVQAGFRTVEEEDITANVVRALELDTPAKRARIERRVPKFLQQHALAFAAIEGSPMYQTFAERKLTYLRFVLERV